MNTLRVRLRLDYGGEDVPALIDELRHRIPGARLVILPLRPDEEPGDAKRIEITSPIAGGYGQASVQAWSDIKSAIRRAWGRDRCEHHCYRDDLYELVDSDGTPLGRIVPGDEAGGWRDHLDGQPIHCGDILEVLAPDGRWISGRYEVVHRPSGRPLPMFHIAVWHASLVSPMPEQAIYRWPVRQNAPV